MPDVPSCPWNARSIARLFQPFASGGRAGVAPVTTGAVASYPRASDRVALLPATSVHEPVTAAVAASGPPYGFAGSQEPRPEVASLPAKLTVSGRLYQPFASGARLGVAVTCGAVESYLSGRDADPMLPALSTQVPATAAVALSGPEYVSCASQESSVEVASPPVKPTATGATYQPLGRGARAGAAVTVGAVASYLSVSAPAAEFPARSRQAPLTLAEAASGPEEIFAASQESNPDLPS